MNEEYEPDPKATMEPWEREPRSDAKRRILKFTMTRTEDEYIAEAMLLGMGYSRMHHLFTTFKKVLDPDTHVELPMSSDIYRIRVKMVTKMRGEDEQS